ncbi:TPA: hypothetical protein ACQQ5N_002926 [Pseudomonas aeruginosa]
MSMLRTVFALVALALFTPALAFAADLDWQWNDAGAAGFYSGSINLNGGAGGSPFSRYDVGMTPNMTNDTVSTPPVLLMAGGADIDFQISNTGVPIDKKECTAPAALEVYATPVSVCYQGPESVQGFYVGASQTSTTFTPRLYVLVSKEHNGIWREVQEGHACGRLEVKQFCK